MCTMGMGVTPYVTMVAPNGRQKGGRGISIYRRGGGIRLSRLHADDDGDQSVALSLFKPRG